MVGENESHRFFSSLVNIENVSLSAWQLLKFYQATIIGFHRVAFLALWVLAASSRHCLPVGLWIECVILVETLPNLIRCDFVMKSLWPCQEHISNQLSSFLMGIFCSLSPSLHDYYSSQEGAKPAIPKLLSHPNVIASNCHQHLMSAIICNDTVLWF